MKYIDAVPAILSGPMDVTVEYSDTLTASFSCTASGGNGTMLDFIWSTNSASGLDSATQADMVNTDGSITSTISTYLLELSDRGSEYTCDVSYSGSSEESEDSATLTIGTLFTTGTWSCIILMDTHA